MEMQATSESSKQLGVVTVFPVNDGEIPRIMVQPAGSGMVPLVHFPLGGCGIISSEAGLFDETCFPECLSEHVRREEWQLFIEEINAFSVNAEKDDLPGLLLMGVHGIFDWFYLSWRRSFLEEEYPR